MRKITHLTPSLVPMASSARSGGKAAIGLQGDREVRVGGDVLDR